MSVFNYIDGELHADAVAVKSIAASVGTPVYIYSATRIASNFRRYRDAFENANCTICYSIKANSNLAVLRLLNRLGAGFDAVSGGEIHRALSVGAPGGMIVFSGVGKTRPEMELALAAGVRHFNVESVQELLRLDEVSGGMGKIARVAVRVNPDVDARTHTKVSTGRAEDKFGVPIAAARSVYERATELPNVDCVGLAMHIGSQIMSLEPFLLALRKLAGLVRELRAAGLRVRSLDVGGGVGIRYSPDDPEPPDVGEYARMVRRELDDPQLELELEPGRSIVGNAGILASSVVLRKEGAGRDFLVLDAAMNDLVRPAMYGAHHDIVPVSEPCRDSAIAPIDVVGPVCESGDRFAAQRLLPKLEEGELVVIKTAGAYCAAMASEYNSRPLAPEVLVSGSRWAVVRRRPRMKESLALESVPEWT